MYALINVINCCIHTQNMRYMRKCLYVNAKIESVIFVVIDIIVLVYF